MLFVIPPPAEGSMSPEALAALIERHGQTVLRTAALYLKDRARAEDVCQEVFLRLYRTNPAFQSPEHEKAFVLRVTINLCKDQLKSFWARRVVLDGEQEPPPGSDIADQGRGKRPAPPPLLRRSRACPSPSVRSFCCITTRA